MHNGALPLWFVGGWGIAPPFFRFPSEGGAKLERRYGEATLAPEGVFWGENTDNLSCFGGLARFLIIDN